MLLHVKTLIADGPPAGSPGTQQRVVIAAHSQGSIIAAAAMLQADSETCSRIALLSFGSPLRRLYTRNFSAYFGVRALSTLRNRERHRWINLWAHSDPIGSYVFDRENRGLQTALREVDCRVLDATSLTARPDGTYPPICGHSGFWTRDEYRDAVNVLVAVLLPARGIAIQGASPAPSAELAA